MQFPETNLCNKKYSMKIHRFIMEFYGLQLSILSDLNNRCKMSYLKCMRIKHVYDGTFDKYSWRINIL